MRGAHHFFGGSFANPVRFAITPDMSRQDGFVAGVNVVADGLACEVVADSPSLETVPGEDFVPRIAIGFAVAGLADIEMVAPTGQLDAVVSERLGFLASDFKGQVGPLAGEKCDWSRHDFLRVLIAGTVVNNPATPRKHYVD
jgi:hypothetical protein